MVIDTYLEETGVLRERQRLKKDYDRCPCQSTRKYMEQLEKFMPYEFERFIAYIANQYES